MYLYEGFYTKFRFKTTVICVASLVFMYAYIRTLPPLKHLSTGRIYNLKWNSNESRSNRGLSYEKSNLTITTGQNARLPTPDVRQMHKIKIYFEGGLGNLMFKYASLYGIARKNNLIPLLSPQNELNRIFKPKAAIDSPWYKFPDYKEKKGCTFEPEVMQLGGQSDRRLLGYFQSWRYFRHVEDDLRDQFEFSDSIQVRASRQLHDLVFSKDGSNSTTYTYIGVHVRRGDMAESKRLTDYGYTTAGKAYLDRAMGYFRKKYPNTLFVVVSNDMGWCTQNIQSSDVVFPMADNAREIDLAVLSLCNHTVMTVGSFSWWAAWLARGEAVYYKNFPKTGSQLAKVFNEYDYTYPEWLPM